MGTDVKTGVWHGSLKMAGAKQPVIFNGPIAGIMNQMLRHLNENSLRRDSTGNRSITITIQDNPIGQEANHGLDADFLAGLDMTLVDQATADDPRFAQAPWAEDADFKRLMRYMATHSNYVTALPGEVNELIRRLKDRFPADTSWMNPMTHQVEYIKDKLVDRRAR